jgi:competence protein ComEC
VVNCYQIPILRFLLPFIFGLLFLKNKSENEQLILWGFILFGCFIFIIISQKAFRSYFRILSLLVFNVLLGSSFNLINEDDSTIPFTNYGQKLEGKIIIKNIVKQNESNCTFTFSENNHLFIAYLLNKSKSYYPNDTLIVQGLKIQNHNSNDTTFSGYKTYLINKGIEGTSFLKEKQITTVHRGNGINHTLYQFRYFLTQKINQSNVFKPQEKSIFLSLLLGEKSYLAKDTKSQYIEAGVVHVLAISGLHVGIVFMFLQLLFRLLPFHNKIIGFTAITLTLCFYALLSGLSASVLRACLMCIIIQFSTLLSVRIQNVNVMLNVVFSSAYFLLLFNPNFINDVGFQLSYSAVIYIIIGVNKTKEFRISHGKLTQKIIALITVNCFAFLGTTPLLLYHFNDIYFGSVLSGLFIIPLVSVTVLLGVFSLLLIPFDAVFHLSLKICNYSLFFLNQGVSFFAKQLSGKYTYPFSLVFFIGV